MQRWDPVDILIRAGGSAPGTMLAEFCGDWHVRKAVAQGRIVRAARNRYLLPEASAALAAAARLNGTVSHLSAALHWEIKVRKPPRLPDVTLPRKRRPRDSTAGVTVHWHDLPDEHVAAPGVTTPARTVIDCARSLPLPDALSVADSALRRRLVTPEQLGHALASSPHPGRVAARRVLAEATPLAANPFESSLRAIALDVPGLKVVPQYLVEHVGHVDLCDPRMSLVLEADSHTWHGSPGQFRYDIRRHAALLRAGWTVVRFCWEDVMSQAAYVRGLLADLVHRGPDSRPVQVSFHDRRL